MVTIKDFLNNSNIKKIDFNNRSSFEDNYIALLDAINILSNGEAIKQDILLYKDKIVAIDTIDDEIEINSVIVIDAQGKYLTPPIIDQHTHGAYGCDFNNCDEKELLNLLKKLPAHGIGALLPTVMTDDIKNIKKQIVLIKSVAQTLDDNCTKIIGVHLEGPFLNQKYKGIQPDEYILKPTIEFFNQIDDEIVKMISFSPEHDKNYELTKLLSKKGIVASAGHTAASSEQIEEAQKHGLSQTTHTFNAMSGLHHRNPGVVGEALSNDNIYTEVIADLAHVHSKVLKILFRSKPKDRVILVSDSLPLSKSKEDELIFGTQKIYKQGEKAVNDKGVMAGSLLLLDDILYKLLNADLISFEDFICYASYNISAGLKLNNGIVVGNEANFVIWDSQYKVEKTILNGKIAYYR